MTPPPGASAGSRSAPTTRVRSPSAGEQGPHCTSPSSVHFRRHA